MSMQVLERKGGPVSLCGNFVRQPYCGPAPPGRCKLHILSSCKEAKVALIGI